MKVVTACQMQHLDRRTIEEAGISGATLMERAGSGIASIIEQVFGPPKGKMVTIICGKGNNGGDGFVVARHLYRKQAKVRVLLLASPQDLTRDAKSMYQRFVKSSRRSAVISNGDENALRSLLCQSDLIVDALLGTGITSQVKDRYRTTIQTINEAQAPVISVDLPSGIHTDTGEVLGIAVRASVTGTFGCPKLGLYTGSGVDHAGEIFSIDIGIPQSYVDALNIQTELITKDTVLPLIPLRAASSHKGTFGHAGIIAGSPGKTGAAALAARSVLRVGTGLVTIAAPARAQQALEAKVVEVMTVPMPETETGTLAWSALDQLRTFASSRSAVAIGPGLTTQRETAEVVRSLIQDLECPLVLDADALNALAGHTKTLLGCKITPILTPHPGEMARLLEQTTPKTINQDRIGVAQRFAKDFQTIVILKGARTVVAAPDGRTAICSTGNPGMATAGTGDALTGILVGLLAQGLTPWNAACAGVYLHGLAGDLAAKELGQAGMIAGDLVECLPYALSETFQNK